MKRLLMLTAGMVMLATPAMAQSLNTNSNTSTNVNNTTSNATGTGSAQLDANISTGGYGNGSGNSINVPQQAPAVIVSAPGLAGLATSDCVLSDTKSFGAAISVAQVGIGGAYGDGHTRPYDECNKREAIKVLGQMTGTIQGVPVPLIISNMAGTLTGVQDAINQAKGGKPAQTSSLQQAPAVVQTASIATDSKPAWCATMSHGMSAWQQTCQ